MATSKRGRRTSRTRPTVRRGSASATAGAKAGPGGPASPESGRPTRKAGAKKTVTLSAPAEQTPRRRSPPAARAVRRAPGRASARGRTSGTSQGIADLFAPLTEGERAAALRILTADPRLSAMAQIGRYRVVAAEPLPVKRPRELAEHRLARVVAYDYAADRCVDASVDLDTEEAVRLSITRSQPALAPEEEEAACAAALADDRVQSELSLGDEPQAAMQYWSPHTTDLARTRRSAAVLFGQPGARPTTVVVIDLLDGAVTEVVPAAEW